MRERRKTRQVVMTGVDVKDSMKFSLNLTVSIRKHIGRHHGEDEHKDESSGRRPHWKLNKGDEAGSEDCGAIKWKPAD